MGSSAHGRTSPSANERVQQRSNKPPLFSNNNRIIIIEITQFYKKSRGERKGEREREIKRNKEKGKKEDTTQGLKKDSQTQSTTKTSAKHVNQTEKRENPRKTKQQTN